jgi:hypothetical protein
MQVVGLSYRGDTVTLDLEALSWSFGKELSSFVSG